jgi:hypothetical protein
MRYAPAGGLMLLAVLASPGAAQPPAGEVYVVKDSGAEVRAMADDKPESYVTNRLKKGDTVVVVEAVPNSPWLKIQPPAGSTSWISRAMLKDPITAKQIEVVDFDPGAPVIPGPADRTEKRPKVIGAYLKRGHLVTRLDNEIKDEKEGWWIEIESPQSEARYVRAESVEKRTAPAVLPASATAPAEAGPLRRSSHPSAGVGPSAKQMRDQAVRADESGDYAEAVRLYEEIVDRFGESLPRLAEASRKRADYLRGKSDAPDSGIRLQEPKRMASTPTVSLGESKGAAGRDRDVPTGASTAPTWEQRSQELTDPRNVRTYRGWLSASHSQPIYGQKPYLLTLSPTVAGLQVLYVVSGHVGLEGLVGKMVELRGPLTYQGEMRSYVMQVTQAGEAQ